MTIRGLGLGMDAVEQQFRRMAFNVIARNQDDHVKNIAFLMDRDGRWSLSPAFDLTYAYRPDGTWTRTHQMSLNGRREGFSVEDFSACAGVASMKRGRAQAILAEVRDSVRRWRTYAAEAGVDDERTEQIESTHLLELPRA
jgi:serine/threonine-protein kinase HipA